MSAELIRDGETGLLTPERDPDSLATALASLITDPVERARLGAAGQAHVRNNATGVFANARGDKILDTGKCRHSQARRSH